MDGNKRNLNCFYSIFAEKHNSHSHFKYIKKHKIILRNFCFGIFTLCSPKKSLFLLNSNKSSTVGGRFGTASIGKLCLFIVHRVSVELVFPIFASLLHSKFELSLTGSGLFIFTTDTVPLVRYS